MNASFAPGGPESLDPVHARETGAFDVVVMVGSLGGPEVIREIVGGLPDYFPATVVVVQHRATTSQHLTLELLRYRAHLPVEPAEAGVQPQPRTVYVTPADRQLVLGDSGAFAYPPGFPGRNHADPLFASIARRYGPRAIGIVVSGSGEDGAAGVVALKRAGGRVLVQDRASARCFGMPAAAIATGCVDLVLPAGRIAAALISLVLWPGAADLLRVSPSPWAMLDGPPARPVARADPRLSPPASDQR